MKGHYWVYIDAATAAAAAATHIAERLDEAVRDRGRDSPLAEEIVRNCCSASLSRPASTGRTCAFWVDERAVPPGHEQSNHSMALEHLITPAGIPESNVVRMEGELALRGGRSLRTYRERFPGAAVPVFDVIHLEWGPMATRPVCFPANP